MRCYCQVGTLGCHNTDCISVWATICGAAYDKRSLCRVLGTRFAELPFAASKQLYRHRGHFRSLMLVLPAMALCQDSTLLHT